ncbi:MAG TPA: HAD family hydrolase, partial [Polyangia bacterium]
INSPYEPPEQPLLTIRSLQASDVERAVGAICDQLGLSSLPRESFDGVILDLFGTLVELPPPEARRALLDGLELSPDSELGRMVAAGAVLAPLMAALGVAYEHGRRLLQTRRFPSIAAAAHALGAAAGGATAAALVSRYERHLAPWYAAYQLAPGAAALLDALVAAGVPIAILSNADSFSAGVVSALGLDRYAKAVLLSCDLGLEKPAAGAFQRAFDALGVDASGAIVIGDGWRSDVEGAVRAGAGAVWINRDGAPSPARLPLPLRRRIIEVPGLATCSRLFADV